MHPVDWFWLHAVAAFERTSDARCFQQLMRFLCLPEQAAGIYRSRLDGHDKIRVSIKATCPCRLRFLPLLLLAQRLRHTLGGKQRQVVMYLGVGLEFMPGGGIRAFHFLQRDFQGFGYPGNHRGL